MACTRQVTQRSVRVGDVCSKHAESWVDGKLVWMTDRIRFAVLSGLILVK